MTLRMGVLYERVAVEFWAGVASEVEMAQAEDGESSSRGGMTDGGLERRSGLVDRQPIRDRS